MAGNTIGRMFSLTSFGESHGEAIGGVIDGCPSGVVLDLNQIQLELDRRKPGQSKLVSQREESDVVQFLSGIFQNTTTGTPIGFIIKNKDQNSDDYDHIKDQFRPSHADYTYYEKYGIRDHRGGGRSSARETACRVVAGAIAKQILSLHKVNVKAYVSSVGDFSLQKRHTEVDFNLIDKNPMRIPDENFASEMIEFVDEVRKNGDSVGGEISCVVTGCPIGLGEPVFDKLNADLAKAMFSINAVKGFGLGSGFEGAKMSGSKHNDPFINEGGKITTKTNHSGGIQGGISNGEDIYFNVAFKPVSTIMKDQTSVDTTGNEIAVTGKGRHDPCVLPRAVPIVEAMTAITLVDHLLRNRTTKI